MRINWLSNWWFDNWFMVIMYAGVFGSAWLADKTGHWQWIFGCAGTELAGAVWIVLKFKGVI